MPKRLQDGSGQLAKMGRVFVQLISDSAQPSLELALKLHSELWKRVLKMIQILFESALLFVKLGNLQGARDLLSFCRGNPALCLSIFSFLPVSGFRGQTRAADARLPIEEVKASCNDPRQFRLNIRALAGPLMVK